MSSKKTRKEMEAAGFVFRHSEERNGHTIETYRGEAPYWRIADVESTPQGCFSNGAAVSDLGAIHQARRWVDVMSEYGE